MEDEYAKRKKKWHLDIKNTPCARNALLNGIIGGGAFGLLYFLKSGVVRRSCDIAVGGFAIVSFLMWEACRYEKAKLRSNLKQTVKILNNTNANKKLIKTATNNNSYIITK